MASVDVLKPATNSAVTRPARLSQPLRVPEKPAASIQSNLSTPDQYQANPLPGNQYDLPAPTNKDKWNSDFRKQSLYYGRRGWKRYGDLIKEVAKKYGIDPFILGAYTWNESDFNAHQDFSKGSMRAIGLSSVQAQYHTKYTIEQLMEPRRNLSITAREFKSVWKPERMSETFLDVFYPAWRRKDGQIPGFKNKEEYLQLVANKLYNLRVIDAEMQAAAAKKAAARTAANAIPASKPATNMVVTGKVANKKPAGN